MVKYILRIWGFYASHLENEVKDTHSSIFYHFFENLATNVVERNGHFSTGTEIYE
jgi:hypothetical protein